MNYFGTFCTVILKHVQAAYTIRGPFPLAMLMIIFKPTSEARSYGQDFYFPTEFLQNKFVENLEVSKSL
jgi:tetrahydromethanopterin S-methyltransferase subunit E